MELFSSNMELFLYIFSKESCSYISRNKKPEKVSYIFSRESFPYISVNGKPRKNPGNFEGNGTFLYFRKGIFGNALV